MYSKKPCHVEVTLEECGGNEDRMIKKFMKKLHKSNLLKDLRERSVYMKPSQQRHNGKMSKKYLARKR